MTEMDTALQTAKKSARKSKGEHNFIGTDPVSRLHPFD